MGDLRFGQLYDRLLATSDVAQAIRELDDTEVIAALAGASMSKDPYLANVLATEAGNRAWRKSLIIDTAFEGMYSLDRDGVVTYVNPAAARILGWSQEELVGANVHDTVHYLHEDGSFFPYEKCPLTEVARNGSTYRGRTWFVHKSGRTFPVDVSSAPVIQDGSAEGAVVTFTDASESVASDRRRLARAAVSEIIASMTSAAAAMPRIVDALGRALQWPVVEYWAPGPPDDHLLRCAHWSMDEGDEIIPNGSTRSFDRGEGIPGKAFAAKTPNRTAIAVDPESDDLEMASSTGGPPVLASQVKDRVHVHGVILFRLPADAQVGTDVKALVEDLGGVIGQFMSRAEADARRDAKARQQAAIASLGAEALAGKGSQDLMDHAVSLIAETMDVPLCKVLQCRTPGDLLLRAGVGWQDGLVGVGTVSDDLESQAGFTLMSPEPVIVHDLRSETRFSGPKLLHDHGVRSGISVRIAGRDETWGVLGAHTQVKRDFTRADITFILAVANVIANAIQREEADAERERLLAEAHRRVLTMDPVADDDGTAAGAFNAEGSGQSTSGHGTEVAPETGRFVHGSAGRADEGALQILDSLPVGIIITTRDTGATFANSTMEEMLDVDRDWLVGKTLANSLWRAEHPGGAPFDCSEIPSERVFATGMPVANIPLIIRLQSGNRIGTRVSAAPLRVVDGRVTDVIVSFMPNIEEPFQSAGLADREETDQYRAIVYAAERARLGMAITRNDPAGAAVLYVNQVGASILGKEASELLGTDAMAALAPREYSRLDEIRKRIHGPGPAPDSFEAIIHYSNGEEVTVDVGVSTGSFNGQPVTFAFFRDITERKVADTQLQEMAAELESRIHERTHELEEANRELESFSYSVSHDLRAPLRAIDYLSRAILEDHSGSIDKEAREWLEQIHREADRMTGLVNDLLNLSRAARVEIVPTDVDVSRLARDVVASLAESDAHHSVQVKIADNLHITGDEPLVRVVLENLLGNAWKFSADAPKPVIEVERSSDESTHTGFVVRDNGIGFPESATEQLFKPFERLPGARSFPGTGVGLATVHRIITRHNGTIRAESQEGGGAAFHVSFPRVPSEKS